MERFRGTWGHVTDQLNELKGLGTWIMPTKQASSLVPRPGNETSKRGADSGNSKAYGEKCCLEKCCFRLPCYGSQTSPVHLCMPDSVIRARLTSLYGFQPSSLVLCMQNSDFRTRLTSLYGSQTSSVVLSTHNSVLSIRINRLYWFQPWSVCFVHA